VSRRRLGGLVAIVAAAIVGCAPLPPPQPRSAQPAAAGGSEPVRSGAPAHAGGPAPTAAAPVDSSPSADARAVLVTIPEPIAPADRVPPPSLPPAAEAGPPTSAPPVAADSARRAAPSDTSRQAGAGPDTVAVPVPEPTQPLGERPGAATPAITDSMLRPRAAPEEAPKPDTCWRVQIVARKDKATADKLRSAAQSQLLVSFSVEHEARMYKVRSVDCLSRPAAESLRDRAVQSGFKGAFMSAVKSP
jgi:hypothetical protein